MSGKHFGKYSKKTAFTLVELLIVVIIVGILAAMMLLSAGAATDSAKATRIISDLRNVKAAALLYRADRGSWPIWYYDEGSGTYKSIPPSSPGPQNYSDLNTAGDGYWVGAMRESDDHSIAFSVADLRKLSEGVKKSIEKQARNKGLFGDTFTGMPYMPELNNLQKFNADQHNMLLSVINK